MSDYKYILVAIDLSEESGQLVAHAKALAALHQAALSMVHIIDYTPSQYASSEIALPVDLESMDQSLLDDTHTELNALSEKFQIDAKHCWLLQGEKEDEMLKLVDKVGVDLVVTGAHDKHGLGRLFNSTPETLLHALPCDILSVKIKG